MLEVEVIEVFEDVQNKNKLRTVGDKLTVSIERANELMYDNDKRKAFVRIIKVVEKSSKKKGSE